MLIENKKSQVILAFIGILIFSLFYFNVFEKYNHKIYNGIIKAKVILPARVSGSGKYAYSETFIFMVEKDSITEKFETDKKTYEAAKVGDFFEAKEGLAIDNESKNSIRHTIRSFLKSIF